MANAALKIARHARQSLWLRPLVLAALGAALGLALPLAGPGEALAGLDPFLPDDPENARELFLAAAGALATVAGVGFSLMMVTVQLAAGTYSPRLLPRFMAQRGPQLALGGFLGIIAYLLLASRALVAGAPPSRPVLLAGLALSLGALALLVFFLHQVTRSVQVSTILLRIGRATIGSLHRLGFDRPERERVDEFPFPPEPGRNLVSHGSGYLELVDAERLLAVAPPGALLRVDVEVGSYVLPGTPLLTAWGGPLDRRTERRLLEAFALGRQRTPDQDVLLGVRELVDVALKALSPAMNDMTTALMVVNELGSIGHAIARVAGAGTTWVVHRRDGKLLLVPGFGLEPFLSEALAELPQACADHPRVLFRILEVLAELAARTPDPEVRPVLHRWGGLARQALRPEALLDRDRRLLDEKWRLLAAACARREFPVEHHPVH